MSMGSREDGKQGPLWVATSELARGEGHVFYRKLNELLARHGFDAFVEGRVRELGVFAETMGRPSIPPGVYCRMMFVGFFEGLSSERGIAWRCGDSHSLREFLGYGLTEATPDHSTLSVMRHRLPEGFHREVFDWVLKVAAEEKVLKGRRLAIDATTLEANAAMRTIVRRADGASYQKYLKKLAKAEGIENPTPQDLGRMDRKRKGKKVSNKEWKSPSDPDARIARMKDGTTHLAHKAEHAVDLESGVVMAAEIHAADQGDTRTLPDTLERAEASAQKAKPGVMIKDVVTDCGYNDTQTLEELDQLGYRTCIPERKIRAGRRRWEQRARRLGRKRARRQQRAFYRNRRRVRSEAGKRLLRKRGETVERSFAHALETGGMRRTHLRGRPNIGKRYHLHVAGLNLGIVLRVLFGVGTPRALQDYLKVLLNSLLKLSSWIECFLLLPRTRTEALAFSPTTRSHLRFRAA